MKVLTSITAKAGEKEYQIDFGIADTEAERVEIFKLRYKVYVEKRHYIPPELVPDGLEKDFHDEDGSCTYFVAQNAGKIIGSLRVIQADVLPIHKDYFRLEEQREIIELPSEKKLEIGRLISIGSVDSKYLPRHLIPLGLFSAVVKYAEEKDIQVGYGAIKKYIYDKLQTIKFPIHLIERYSSIFDANSDDPLKNFFNNPEDPVIPVIFYRQEVARYLDKLFKSSIAFKPISKNQFQFLGNARFMISAIVSRIFN